MSYINLQNVSICFILLFIFFIHHFWQHTYYSSSQFQIFLTYMTMISTVIFSVAFVFQIVGYQKAQAEETIKTYSDISSVFFDDILKLFIEHPDMNYYYNELVGLEKISPGTKRNRTLEHEISMLIFSRLAKFTIYYQETSDKAHSEKIYGWVTHIMDTYLENSPTLRHYWTHEYKPKLSGPSSRKFMAEKYKL